MKTYDFIIVADPAEEGGFEDGICLPCYAFITADQG